jgi:plastocyanin
MRLRSSIVFATLALAVACARTPVSPSLADLSSAEPSAATAATPSRPAAGMAAVQQVRSDVLVNMQDACDPTTFNAAIGPGTCVGAGGGMPFNQFVAILTQLGFAGPWRFSPPVANVTVGQSFAATNKGGEVHTFTEVQQFGGGIVPFLNNLAHTPQVAPECTALAPDDFVAPGSTYHEGVDHTGTLKFQCCIHPWMRLEAQASSR